ncbi:MAG: hypothetical protein ACXQTS_03725 [Candidatus Methanospirareceae archaeon]
MARTIEVFVRDQYGSPVENAYVDVDYKSWIPFIISEYELDASEVEVGGYAPEGWKKDEGNNALTNKEGYCRLYLKEDKDYLIRVGKPGYKNEDNEEDWTRHHTGDKVYFVLISPYPPATPTPPAQTPTPPPQTPTPPPWWPPWRPTTPPGATPTPPPSEEILKCIFPRIYGGKMFPRIVERSLLPRLACLRRLYRQQPPTPPPQE